MNNPILLTSAGKLKIEQELAELKGPRRLDLARRLKSAIEMGDLSENADYKAAKEEQSFMEGRIQELESLLSAAVIVEEAESSSTVQIGSTVTVQEEGDQPEVYTLVGANEADPRQGRISYVSPMGAALQGKKKGDLAIIPLPNKMTRKVRILKIG